MAPMSKAAIRPAILPIAWAVETGRAGHHRQAQAGVERILTDPTGYDAKNVNDVICNGGHNPIVKRGETFTCEAIIDSIRWQFPIRFTDDAGNYEVGRP
jgi:hypothetical protein